MEMRRHFLMIVSKTLLRMRDIILALGFSKTLTKFEIETI